MDYLVDKSNAINKKSIGRRSTQSAPIKSFNFITHSLGNFILRNYLFHHQFKRVNKIVFTVPPFKGSIDIVTAALIGEGFFPGVKAKIRKLIRRMPGALELLPTYGNASQFDTKAKHSFFNFNHWQGNIQEGDQQSGGKMKKALQLAKNCVEKELCDLEDLSPQNRARILTIVRGGFDTWQSVVVKKNGPDQISNFVDFNSGLETIDGDGRVPHASSCCYAEFVQTYVLEDALWFRDYSHGFVLKDERLQKLVNRFLFSEKPFNASIPGGSIKRVKRLTKELDEDTNLPVWRIVT